MGFHVSVNGHELSMAAAYEAAKLPSRVVPRDLCDQDDSRPCDGSPVLPSSCGNLEWSVGEPNRSREHHLC